MMVVKKKSLILTEAYMDGEKDCGCVMKVNG